MQQHYDFLLKVFEQSPELTKLIEETKKMEETKMLEGQVAKAEEVTSFTVSDTITLSQESIAQIAQAVYAMQPAPSEKAEVAVIDYSNDIASLKAEFVAMSNKLDELIGEKPAVSPVPAVKSANVDESNTYAAIAAWLK